MNKQSFERVAELLAKIPVDDCSAEREAGLILCEDCQGFFPKDQISDDAGDGEGVWGDGFWGLISICQDCYSKYYEDDDK
jgi:hypothetical protein